MAVAAIQLLSQSLCVKEITLLKQEDLERDFVAYLKTDLGDCFYAS